MHKVVDKRVNKNRRVEYQVDWGPRYTQDRYSWEPEANYVGAQDKIAEYLAQGTAVQADKPKGKRKRR